MRARSSSLVLAALASLVTLGCGGKKHPPAPYVPEVLGRCDDFDPLRRPYFGDTHVHTSLSLDANVQGTRLRPLDAYRFAMGEAVGIQPYNFAGVGLRTLQLERPLDFVVVSDHAEFLGEVAMCTTEGAAGYDDPICERYRTDPDAAFFAFNAALAGSGENVGHITSLCGADGDRCLEAAEGPWEELQEAADMAYDRSSACTFTSFVGYEWSGSPDTYNLHRNVVFRNEQVPSLPWSYLDDPYVEGLWDALDDECFDHVDGCDVLTIPHNSNLSNGLIFEPVDRDGNPIDAAYAARRASFEPIAEVYQHKGDSECQVDTDPARPDPACDFEKLPFNALSGNILGTMDPPQPTDFLRRILGEGLLLRESLGANPFQYGLIASTDTHIGTPGRVSESGHPGHGGAGPSARDQLPVGLPDYAGYSPGGLAVVWAEENSREAIFQAMRRRETYGTSGPRIVVRFFGGWGYEATACMDPSMVEASYDGGVPMGGELPAIPDAATSVPRFIVSAMKDGGTATEPGTDLQVLQIVKGWVEVGQAQFQVFDVAGDAANGAGVDLPSCTPTGTGEASLCTVWEDPDFDPSQPAFYYARVLENPTCRWTARQCVADGITCPDPPAGYEECCDAEFPFTIQERAWTSPIWYQPPP